MRDDPSPAGKTKATRRARLAGMVSLGLVAALGGAWFYRLPLGESLARHALGVRGVPADLHLQRLDFGGATIKALRLGPPEAPDLWAETARVDLTWRGFLPALGSIAIDKGWVRATIDERGVSLGALDRLGPKGGAKAAPKIPDWAISIRDFRLIGVTPVGRFDAAIEARGRLHDDFRATAIVAPTDLIGPKGGLEAFEAHLSAATIEGRITAALDASSVTLAWRPASDAPGTEVSGAHVQARFSAPLELREASVTMEAGADQALAPGSFDIQQISARAVAEFAPFRPGFQPSRFGGAYEAQLGRSEIGVLRVAALRADGPVTGDFTGQTGAITASGVVKAQGGALDSETRRALLKAIPDLGGTPLEPLLTAGQPALDRALQNFDLMAPLALSWAADKARLSVSGTAELAARSGARLTAAPAPDAAPFGIVLPDGKFSGGLKLDVTGAGLPDAGATLFSFTGLDALSGEAEITVRDWRANKAALALDPTRVTFTANAKGGKMTVRGAGALTGPFAGMRLVDAQTPLALAIHWGDGFRVETLDGACQTLRAARIEAAGAIFRDAGAQLCPSQGGAFVLGDAKGRLAGGFVIDALAWRGAMSGAKGRSAQLTAGRTQARISGATDNLVLDMNFAAPEFAARFADERDLRVRAKAVTARLNTSAGAWSITGAIEAGDVRDTALPAQITAFNATWRGAPRGAGHAVFHIENGRGRVFDPADKALYHPIIAGDVNAVLEDSQVRAQGVLSLEEKAVRLGTFLATHDLATGRGEARVIANDISFRAGLQPYDISELARGVVDNVRGPVDVEMHAAWTPEGTTTDGRARIKAIDLASSSLGRVQGLSGEITFDDLTKMTTPPGQKLHVDLINPGITVEDGEISLQLLESQVVALESAKWPFAKGLLSVEPTRIDIAGEETRLSLVLTKVDVAALTQTLNFKGLSATGEVQGRFPLIFTKTNGRIEGGRLEAATGGGVIAYAGDVNPGGAAAIAFDALRTFRYDSLSLDLNGDLDGELVSAINFTGVNREPVNPGGGVVPLRVVGIPFKFNVTVRAPFRALSQSAAGMSDARRYLDEATAHVDVEVEDDQKGVKPEAK